MCQQCCVPMKHRMNVCINGASPLFGVLKSGMCSTVYPNVPLMLSAISSKVVEMSCKEDVLAVYPEMNLPNPLP